MNEAYSNSEVTTATVVRRPGAGRRKQSSPYRSPLDSSMSTVYPSRPCVDTAGSPLLSLATSPLTPLSPPLSSPPPPPPPQAPSPAAAAAAAKAVRSPAARARCGARRVKNELQGPCGHCGVTSSPQWRKGPKGKPILCNACGIRFLRQRSLGKVQPRKRRGAAAAAAAAADADAGTPPLSPLLLPAADEEPHELHTPASKRRRRAPAVDPEWHHRHTGGVDSGSDHTTLPPDYENSGSPSTSGASGAVIPPLAALDLGAAALGASTSASPTGGLPAFAALAGGGGGGGGLGGGPGVGGGGGGASLPPFVLAQMAAEVADNGHLSMNALQLLLAQNYLHMQQMQQAQEQEEMATAATAATGPAVLSVQRSRSKGPSRSSPAAAAVAAAAF